MYLTLNCLGRKYTIPKSFSTYIFIIFYSCDAKLNSPQPLLQSSVSRDRSEIIISINSGS